MICGMTFYEICLMFLLYSFFGWVVEVAFHAVTLGKVINRGFLNGPVCPVYGFGVLSVFMLIHAIEGTGFVMNAFWVFVFGVVLATVVELIAGWLLDVCFHARWWDYSKCPFNLNGYICLEFSLIWGFAILMVVRIFQAFMEKTFLYRIPHKYGWIMIGLLAVTYIADLVVTVAVIQGFNKKLKQLDTISAELRVVSDKISEGVGTKTIETAQMVSEGRVQAALAKAELKDAVEKKKDEIMTAGANYKTESTESLKAAADSLRQKYEELSNSMVKYKIFGTGRILRAFPDMKHREHDGVVAMLREKLERK